MKPTLRSSAVLAASVALVTCAAVFAQTSASATTGSISIASPKAGSSFSLKRTPSFAVAGTVVFVPATQGSTKFFLRRDACGSSDPSAPDNPHMSVVAGNPDGGDGCGSLLYITGLTSQNTSLFTTSYPATDGVPFLFDATRTIQGAIDVESYQGVSGTGGKGAGEITADATLDGIANSAVQTFGSDSETAMIAPGAIDTAIPFTIKLGSDLNEANVGAIALNLRFEGPYAGSGFVGLSGKSYVTVPTVSASSARSVQISVDDPSFSKPVTTTLNSSFTGWSSMLPTPAVGTHTIYARAVQGGATLATASTAITIKR